MELWQLDIVDGIVTVDGTEAKVVPASMITPASA